MNIKRSTTRWLGLALACGIFTVAISAQAGKGVKPEKPPPPPDYTAVWLGMSGGVSDINNSGIVVGAINDAACILNPQDRDGDGRLETWYEDLNGDGQNDLVVSLGVAAGAFASFPTGVNDLGQVIGWSYYWDPELQKETYKGFIVVPEDTDGDNVPDCWYQDLDEDQVNDLMVPLGTLHGGGEDCMPNGINNLGQIVGNCAQRDADGVLHGSAFLLNPTIDESGNTNWFLASGANDANALMVDLGPGFARDINDHGQVIGWSDIQAGQYVIIPEDTNGDGQPDCWVEDGNGEGANNLASPLQPGEHALACAINNAGQVAFAVTGTAPSQEARLLTPADVNGDGAADLWFQDADGDQLNDLVMELGTLQGLNSSGAEGLNAAGWVVGTSWKGNWRGMVVHDAFLWHDGRIQSLTELVGGVVELEFAVAINDAGQILSDGYVLLPRP